MRLNRLTKLAELKKVAEDYSSNIKPGDAEPVYFPPINPPESRDSYIERANTHLGHDHTKDLGEFYDKQVAESGGNSGGSKSTPVKVPAKISTEVIDDAHKGKTLTDNAGYTYVVAPDGKSLTFSIKGSQPKTLNQSYKNWKSVVGNINAIPVTSSGTATPAAQTQTPAATTPAAGEAAKAQQTERQFDANALAGVKAVLVRAATPGGFGLAVTTAANERARIQRMVSVIQKVIGQNIDAYDFLTKMLLVSQRGEQSLVPWFSKENYSNAIATAPRKDVVADKNGTGPFNKPVAAVLSVLNEVYSGDFADDNEGTIKKFKETFVKGIVPAQPAANTAATAAQTGAAPAANPEQPPTVVQSKGTGTREFYNEEEKAKAEEKEKAAAASQVDPRIKKLATLRRLRVRGQMEAATDSSAKFGRSRVS